MSALQNQANWEDWRGVGRPLVIAVLGDPDLVELARDVGVRVTHFETQDVFCEAEPGVTAEAFDALVVAFEPWPHVDGVALARGLRRRCIGTVVVGESGHRFLLAEQLAVVPSSATGQVRRADLQAAIAVAAQETWALASMRDPWADPTWPGEHERTEEHLLEPDVVDARPSLPPPPPPSVTPSQVRVTDAGEASRSTMIQLFGDEDLVGLEAPPRPATAMAIPTWASDGTREWAPSSTMLADLAKGAIDSERPAVGPTVASTEPGPSRTASPTSDPHHGAVSAATAPESSMVLLTLTLLLGVLTGVLAMALWLRG